MQLGSRRLAPVALAGLLVLAGCGGLGAAGDAGGTDSEAEATLTPVDVPGASTPRTPASNLPPGVTPGGVGDPLALARAHARALEGRSYTVRSVVTVQYSNGTLRGRRRTVARVGADRRRFRVVHVTLGPAPPLRPVREGAVRAPGRSELWSDGRGLLRSSTRPNGTVYRSVPPGEYESDPSVERARWRGLAGVGGEDVHLVFNAVRTTVVGREGGNESGNRTAVRIESTGRASAGSVAEAHSIGAAYEYPLGAEFDTVSSVDLTATVGSEGLVREYRFAYTVGDEDGRVRVVRRVDYSAVGGTTVGRPAWYERAVADGTNGTDGAGGTTGTPG